MCERDGSSYFFYFCGGGRWREYLLQVDRLWVLKGEGGDWRVFGSGVSGGG